MSSNTQTKMAYGNINYDVPSHMRQLYPKLRSLFKRRAIMQTMSSYLFPWGMAEEIENGLQKINKDADGFARKSRDQVRYSIFKYDEEISGEALTQSARDALRKQMSRMKNTIMNKLAEIEAGEDVEIEDNIKSAKVACRRANSILRDMQALALIFNLTDDMDVAFVAYAAWIEDKKDQLKSKEDSLKVEDDRDQSNTVDLGALTDSNILAQAGAALEEEEEEESRILDLSPSVTNQ